MAGIIKTIMIFFIAEINCEIPDYIKICQKSDPEVSNCIKNSIDILKPYLKAGIPELDVPPLEPLLLNDLTLTVGSGDTTIGTNLSYIHVWGASEFTINDLRANIASNTFEYRVFVPKLYLKGKYEINTQLLLLHVRGKGDFNVNITDYQFHCIMKGHKIEKSGETYLEFEKMNCDLDFKDASIHLENLFHGNVLLGNVTNTVINDHVDVFFQEIKPNLVLSLEEKFTNVANKITLTFSYDELFP